MVIPVFSEPPVSSLSLAQNVTDNPEITSVKQECKLDLLVSVIKGKDESSAEIIIIRGSVLNQNIGVDGAMIAIQEGDSTTVIQSDQSGFFLHESKNSTNGEDVLITALYGDCDSVSQTISISTGSTSSGQPVKPVPDLPENEISLSMERDLFSRGETVVIKGLISDESGNVNDIPVIIDISGTVFSVTTDSEGNFDYQYQVPDDAGLGTYFVTAKAKSSSQEEISSSTEFDIIETLSVFLNTDKNEYVLGDIVYISAMVRDGSGNLISFADLNFTFTHLESGTQISEIKSTDGVGESIWEFNWVNDTGEDLYIAGEIEVDLTASKTGYADGKASLIIIAK
jgi:hypothetical protein